MKLVILVTEFEFLSARLNIHKLLKFLLDRMDTFWLRETILLELLRTTPSF